MSNPSGQTGPGERGHEPRPLARGAQRFTPEGSADSGTVGVLRAILKPVASLKLTVALLAMAIFIIFAGTFALTKHDMWDVIRLYFRTPFAFIEADVFFPKSFFPGDGWDNVRDKLDGKGFYFPGGWGIGALMFLNLLAAHTLRFKLQTRGSRLWIGLGVIGLGAVVTALVVLSGSNKDGVQGQPLVSWDTLWHLFQGSLFALLVALVFGIFRLSPRQKVERSVYIALASILGLLGCWVLFGGDAAKLNDSSMRILWQLAKGTFAACVLLGGCILAFKKRAGIVLLHGGIGLLMVSELLVGTSAVESQMSIVEGERVNWVRDSREWELAIIDASDPVYDDVVAIPQGLLLEETEEGLHGPEFARVAAEELPFGVQIVRFYPNSDLVRPDGRMSDEDRKALAESQAELDQQLKALGDGKAHRLAAIEGIGQDYAAINQPLFTGAGDSRINIPSAYVVFFDRETKQPIATRLLSLLLTMQVDELPETVTVGGKKYELFLRHKQTYKDYWIYLDDIQKNDYLGTDDPKDYSSYIHITSDKFGIDRDDRVWMNNPLRAFGETFYQSNYNRLQSGLEATTFSVVTNTGWMLPYVALMIVMVGMLFQFLLTLERFLRRKQETAEPAEVLADSPWHASSVDAVPRRERRGAGQGGQGGHGGRKRDGRHKGEHRPRELAPVAEAAPSGLDVFGRWLPLIVVVLAAVAIGYAARKPRGASPGDIVAFGKLPVVFEGRVKPMDSLARTTLRMISNGETAYDKEDKKYTATQWMLDVVAKNAFVARARKEMGMKVPDELADDKYYVLRIDNPEVVRALGIEQSDSKQTAVNQKRHLFSVAQIREKQEELDKQVKEASAVHEDNRSAFQRKILELQFRLNQYANLEQTFFAVPFPTRDQASERQQAVLQYLQIVDSIAGQIFQERMVVPRPVAVGDKEGNWEPHVAAWREEFFPYIRAQIDGGQPPKLNPSFAALQEIFDAYVRKDATGFDKAVTDYRISLEDEPRNLKGHDKPLSMTWMDTEVWYNHFQPFKWCAWLYLLAIVIGFFGWLGWSGPLNRTAFWLILFTFAVHTFAVCLRIYIGGRPPVTTLFTSALFIGWGCVGIGLILEAVFRLGIGNLVAAIAGASTLLIAYRLNMDVTQHQGDTFKVMEAVLDTTFWLTTHVICITLGYAATFLAGLLGILYIVRGLCTPSLSPKLERQLYRMTYGSLCFALFLSFVGTVLGGLWADDSWGRFWGWDPKENGALIIVLWNALILHARWDGMIKERGLAVLAVVGNIVTAWSWFGVNELRVGLHSYGFTEGALFWLGIFIASQLAIIAAGCLPKDLWWSSQRSGE